MKFFSAKKIFPPKKIKLRVQIKISEIQISEKSDFRLNAMKKILSRKIIKIYVFTFERI